MGPIEAFLLGVMLTAGINGIGIKYIKDQHAKEKATLVAKLHGGGKKPNNCVKTVHESVKEGSFTMQQGAAHIQVNTNKDAKTRVRVEKDGNSQRVTINSGNTTRL